MASQRNGTLYIGITNNLERRVFEHKTGLIKGFTDKYKIHQLVYYEYFYNVHDAINREKQIKEWKRKWKLELIEKDNPDWKDLSKDWTGSRLSSG